MNRQKQQKTALDTNPDQSSGTGLVLGSSSSRDGFKTRRLSATLSKNKDKKSNFLVLNAITTHRVPPSTLGNNAPAYSTLDNQILNRATHLVPSISDQNSLFNPQFMSAQKVAKRRVSDAELMLGILNMPSEDQATILNNPDQIITQQQRFRTIKGVTDIPIVSRNEQDSRPQLNSFTPMNFGRKVVDKRNSKKINIEVHIGSGSNQKRNSP